MINFLFIALVIYFLWKIFKSALTGLIKFALIIIGIIFLITMFSCKSNAQTPQNNSEIVGNYTAKTVKVVKKTYNKAKPVVVQKYNVVKPIVVKSWADAVKSYKKEIKK